MALGDCAEGFIRLFFVFIAFLFNHLGWAITSLLALGLIFWFLRKFRIGSLQMLVLLLILFFVFFLAAAYFTGAPVCEFANELSQVLV